MAVPDTPKDKKLLKLLDKARNKRSNMQYYINDCYDFAMLDDRHMVNEERTVGENRDNDLFDTTFADSVQDFATNQQDHFTPDYRPWVNISANEFVAQSDTEAAELADALKSYQDTLYQAINGSSFYEAAEEAWKDCAASVGAVAIPYTPPSEPAKIYPVFMSELLLTIDPRGNIDGRWSEKKMSKEYIKAEMPDMVDAISTKLPRFKTAKMDAMFVVIQGNHRDWSKPGMVYYQDLVIGEKVIMQKSGEAGVPPMIIPLRWSASQTSGWAYGPCKTALPNARLLDELGYNNLVHLSYASKMPVSYENDGQQNYENGIEPGGAYPRARGSTPPQPITPGTKADDYFDQEVLRRKVQQAMYVDEPEQRGKTPPTTTQWLDERAKFLRRQAKRRVYREFVLPALRRLAWLFARRGEVAKIRIDGKDVIVEFQSPMAQTADANEVSSGIQLAQTIISTFGESGVATIKAYETALKWKEKLKDDTVELTQASEQDDTIQKLLTEGRNTVSDGG